MISPRTLLLTAIGLLDVAVLANHFGASLNAIFHQGWNGDLEFGFYVATAGLIVYVLPFISLILGACAWLLTGWLHKYPLAVHDPTFWRIIALLAALVALLFLLEGYVFGAFVWPWSVSEAILWPLFR
jgi:hypothetical protein